VNSGNINVLRSVAELEALADDWRMLSERFGTPLLDHDWFLCAAQALHHESDLRVVTVRQDGVLTAVAPMAVDQSGRYLANLGTSVLHEPSGWLFASEAALRKLVSGVVDLGKAIVLDRTSSAICDLLPRLARWQAVTIRRQTASSFIVPTNQPWESYCASLSSRTKRKLDAARARAERHGGAVRIVRLAPGPDEVDQALAMLVGVEATGWKSRQGSALASRADLFRFFQLYARRAASKGSLRVSVLWIGDKAAAVELGVVTHGRMWGLKLAYDEQFAACAPAIQLVHSSIKEATALGLSAYEFLGSAESWQERWRPERRGYELTVIYPLSPPALITALQEVTSFFTRGGQRRGRPLPVIA